MSTSIKITLWVVVVAMLVVPQIIMVELSPQHAEFLRVFFIEFPKTLFERWFSAFL